MEFLRLFGMVGCSPCECWAVHILKGDCLMAAGRRHGQALGEVVEKLLHKILRWAATSAGIGS